jgi:hypothetical protein
MNPTAGRMAVRASAIAIAIAAAIDPAVTSNRPAKPIVAVVATHARDSSFARHVANGLGKQFTVVRAPLATANATVVVGDNVPEPRTGLATPVFAVFSERSGPTVTIERAVAPATAPLAARVRVNTALRVTGARGRTVDLSLQANQVVVDRTTRAIRSDDERIQVPLTFVPTAPGAAPLWIHASLGGADTTNADVGVDVRDTRWAVLVYDARPSWMSTFVRRALERDPRFVVTSRVLTSRGVSRDVGQPPARLDDIAALQAFDAIVLGAPDALGERDLQGVESFLRRRAGSVVMLLDHRSPGPYERLLDVSVWSNDSTGKAESIVATDSMRAAELMWPTRLPSGATVVAFTREPSPHPIVWSAPIGAGRVIASGALDAWRFRDPSTSSFDRFWQGVVANAAAAAPAPVVVRATHTVASPGERVGVTALVRDAAISAAKQQPFGVSAALMTDARATPIRIYPGDHAGSFHAIVRAPTTPGVYRLAVAANGARGDASLMVRGDAAQPSPEAPDLVRAWAESRGGVAINAADVGSLGSRLVATIHPADRRMTWHPMRSAWWILPFAALLSLEWWLRRRRGLS